MTALAIRSTPAPRDSALTPLAALRAVAHATTGDYTLLHSGSAGGGSVLGVEPLCRLLVDAAGAPVLDADPALRLALPPLPPGAPLEALQALVETLRFPQPHPLIGWLGFISYDIARFLEDIAPPPQRPAPDERAWPTLCFTLYRHYLLFDPATQTATACAFGEYTPPFDWSALLHAAPSAHRDDAPPELVGRESPAAYAAKIGRVKAYIAAGDIYQANLAQRWIIRTAARPHEVFCRLCAISPAPHAACLRFHDGLRPRHVVSASPELFLTVSPDDGEGRAAITRPIKGTRPRDLADAARDAALRDELLHSAKDHAELTMIVDLLRNDLGRVAEYGTVRVVQARELERHPTVWHTVATIAARLRRNVRLAELLAAVCPGGSISGTPKIRALQVIEELEGFRRGLYCGNIGAIGDGGDTIALNIAIRTLLFQEGHAYAYAGGGIVADSDPAQEHAETLHKAAALFRALGLGM